MNTLLNKSWAKGLVLLLVIAVTLSFTPLFSFGQDIDDADRKWQTGQYVQVGDDGKVIANTGKDSSFLSTSSAVMIDDKQETIKVDYEKSIDYANSSVDQNKFKVDLKITTNDVGEKRVSSSSIVLIFDVSTSMDDGLTSDSTAYPASNSRWGHYKEAMADFIDSFLDEDGENYVEGNQISIVAFGGRNKVGDEKDSVLRETAGAQRQICNWTTSSAVANSTYENYDRVSESNVSSTSTKPSLRKDKFGDNGTKWGATNGEAGFIAGKTQLNTPGNNNDYTSVIYVSDGEVNRSSDGESNAVSKAIEAAVDMKDSCDKLYTFAIGKNVASSRVLTPKNLNNTNDKNNPAVDMKFTVDENKTMQEQFKAIAHDITHNVHLWTVTDPMSDHVTYEGLANSNNSGVSFDDSSKTLSWNLQQFPAQRDESTGISTYNISYYVSLNSDKVDGSFYPTNKVTELKYAYASRSADGKTTIGPERTAQFMIPTVMGIPDEPGKIFVEKVVEVTSGKDFEYDADTEFRFGIQTGENTYAPLSYKIVDTDVVVTPNDGIIRLTAGQKAEILNHNYSVGQSFNLVEIGSYSNYTCSDSEKNVTVTTGDQTITFTNVYSNVFTRTGDVAATKAAITDVNKRLKPGDEIEYSITVANNTNTDAAVKLTDPIPEGTTFISAGNGGAYDSVKNEINWVLSFEKDGAPQTVTFKVKVNEDLEVTEEHKIVNIANYTYDGETDYTNKITHYVDPLFLTFDIEKYNEPGDGKYVGTDGIIEYFIKVTNKGEGKLKDLVIRDTVPTNTKFVEFTDGLSKGQNNDSELTWDIGELAVDDSVTVSFKVKVDDGLVADTVIRNVARATNSNDPGENDWAWSKEVTNLIPEVKGEEATPVPPASQGTVLGETADDPVTPQKVLGEEAKTGDSTTAMPYLVVMLIASLAVMGAVFVGLKKRED